MLRANESDLDPRPSRKSKSPAQPPPSACCRAPLTLTRSTCVNIKATKQFSINIISEPFVEASNYTCIDAPFSQDEWKLSGLTPVPSTHIKPPRVGESAFSMECELGSSLYYPTRALLMAWCTEMFYDMYDPKDASKLTSTMVLGRVKLFHAREDIIDDSTSRAALPRS